MPFWREKSFDFLQRIYQIFGIGFFIILLERKTLKNKTPPSLSLIDVNYTKAREIDFLFSIVASTIYDQRR